LEVTKNVYQNVEYVYYIDESYAGGKCIYAALGIPIKQWNHIYARVQAFRQYINNEYGIQLYKELHATKFVNGRGEFTKDKVVTKFQRSEIFKLCLKTIASEYKTGIHTFSTLTDTPENSLMKLLNCIHNIAEQSNYYAQTFFDSGYEVTTEATFKKMKSISFTPGQLGRWDGNAYEKNISISRIVMDTMFIDSAKDYMIQVTDFIAYSLKTMYEPSTNAKKYGLEDSYKILKPIFLKQASTSNEFGIIE